MKKIAKYFFEGLLVLTPIFVSIYLIYAVFKKIDGLLGIPVPGAGFLATLILITFIGLLASNFFTKKFIAFVERLFIKLPVVKILYTSIKDLIGAFVGDKKSFTRPVLVTINPESNAKALGFVVRETLEFLDVRDHAAVYMPHSYNFSGNLFIFPKNQITPISADSAEVMAFIVSGGISGGMK